MFILINDLIGLDALASAKRGGSQYDGGFKLPKERMMTSIAASAEDEDKSELSVVEESEQGGIVSRPRHSGRRYRDTTSETSYAGTFFYPLYSCCHL